MTEQEEIKQLYLYLKFKTLLKSIGFLLLIVVPWVWIYLLFKFPAHTIFLTIIVVGLLILYFKLKYKVQLLFDKDGNYIFPDDERDNGAE